MSLHYLMKYERRKWHHSEIRIAINDESQGSIAKNLRCDELLYYTFIIHSASERIFTARCYASAVLAMSLCPWLRVCLSVCPSVCHKSWVLLKWLNVGSHKQHNTIPQGVYSFLMPKISAKFDRGHPLRGRQMQVGWVKIGDFRQVTGYISKTVKDKTHSFY